jgi:CheY-like chemotaxis protein
VLISDLAMPGEDGYNLIRKVRMLPPEKGGQIPAIAISALGLEDRTRALASGFQHFFIKPIDPPEVVAVITDLLDLNQ